MKKAFTLAEVLITLGIIGVVAAITMSMLISNYQKKVTAERLKQVYSVLHQVLLKSQDDNGQLTDWEFGDNDASSAFVPNFREKYIDVYFKSLSTYKFSRYLQNSAGENLLYCSEPKAKAVITPEGWGYWLCRHPTPVNMPVKSLNYFYILVDLNGPKSPNRVGRDIFYFPINHNGSSEKGLLSGSNKNISDESFKKNCHDASKTGDGYSNSWSTGSLCALWIMHNDWKIPEKDYPW